MRYVKRRIPIEAEQFWPSKIPWPEGVKEILTPSGEQFWIATLEGGHVVTPGDWIITGVRGEKYPCKPDIFEETYEEWEEYGDSTD